MEYEYTDPIHNLSKHQLLSTKKSVLPRGLEFNCTNVKTTNLVASVETEIGGSLLIENVCQQLQT